MSNSRKNIILVIIQIILGLLVIAGIAWLAFKAVAYNQDQQVYRDIEAAYANDEQAGQSAEQAGAKAAPVDVKAMAAEYPDFVGWIAFDDVDISYPVMHGTDNDYYLSHDPSGADNFAGSIFLDYRNNSFDDDLHAIVYGHNMVDDSMFGRLKSYTDESFYKKGTGMFTIFTPGATYRYQIFAAQVVDPADAAYMVGFKTADVFEGFLNELKAKSLYDTGVEVSGVDHVVTLSTCTDADRLIVSAKRVKG